VTWTVKGEHYRKEATIAKLYAADKVALLVLPAVPLDVSKYITVKTNGYGRFIWVTACMNTRSRPSMPIAGSW